MKFILKKSYLIFLLFLSSCIVTNKKIVYFQDTKIDTNYNQIKISALENTFTPTFQIDDLISIYVTALDPISTAPFNYPSNNNSSANVGYLSGAPSSIGYLIDKEGNIDFPILGKIHIADLNRMEVSDILKEKLKDYLVNPIVNIKILNYKVSVLGEVAKPGTFNIPNERITILEAIGIAGDLTIYGKRENILVIREINNEKIKYRIDLTSNELFLSPVYYLKQNDVVYISPNRSKINSSSLNTSNVGIFISTSSLIITTVFLIAK